MRRPRLKLIAATAAVAALAATVFLVNLIWFRPFSLNLFYEKVFIGLALEQPELLTQIGIAEQFGYRAHNAKLDDASVAKVERDVVVLRQNLVDLAAYDVASQTPSQRLSTRVLSGYLQAQLDGERFKFHDYPVNQLFGVQSETPDFMIQAHRIGDRRGAEDYLARLGQFGRKFDQVLEGLALREKLGIVPPRFVIERVLTEMRAFADQPVDSHPLHSHFLTKVEALKDLSADEKGALIERCGAAITSVVTPAYRKMIAFFEGQLNRATTDDGVWKLPDGDAYYAWRLRSETTSDMTPAQVHALGLAEVARIEAELIAALTALSQLRPDETPAQALMRLGHDPAFLYPDTDAGRTAALAAYTQMIDDQLARARRVIGLVPKAAIEVKRIPAFKEKTAPGAYYNPPAADGQRPGVFFANLRDMTEVPKFDMRTLALHEGVPGHHFQIALAQQQTSVPTFRTLLPFTAFQEGWALYAEWLGQELGVYTDDPYGNLGRLRAEMFRAVRLVVDTGIHAKRWRREQAIAYMLAKTGDNEASVVSEIERYIVNPGQACAYTVGMLRIRAARDRAQAALGARFDEAALREFHDVVLRDGSLPLQLMDEQVDAWINTRRRAG